MALFMIPLVSDCVLFLLANKSDTSNNKQVTGKLRNPLLLISIAFIRKTHSSPKKKKKLIHKSKAKAHF